MQFSWPNIDAINVCPLKNGHILAFSNRTVWSSWQYFTWMNKPHWYLKLVWVWNIFKIHSGGCNYVILFYYVLYLYIVFYMCFFLFFLFFLDKSRFISINVEHITLIANHFKHVTMIRHYQCQMIHYVIVLNPSPHV